MNLDEKSKEIHEGLKELGEKYGYGSPAQYTIKKESTQHPQGREYHLSCRIAEEPVLNISVVVDEEKITVHSPSIPLKIFTCLDQVDEALGDVEGWLNSAKQASVAEI